MRGEHVLDFVYLLLGALIEVFDQPELVEVLESGIVTADSIENHQAVQMRQNYLWQI